jgi:hypothetical protein
MDDMISLDDPKALVEFYRKFKDTPPELVKKIAFEQGISTGRILAQQMGIKGNNLTALASLLKIVLGYEPTVEIEVHDTKVHLKNKGFCPLMSACLALNLPWDWMCNNLGWPFFQGLGVAIVPNVDLKILQWRKRGDPYCDHVYTIEQPLTEEMKNTK